jgi:uncharacterized protein with ParB-like and HNH nuclease domain
MRKIEQKDIDLQPDFQRNLVWNRTRQSRLIESILLKIHLPVFYLDATLNDKWMVVDGLQRLTTLDSFYNRKSFSLTNLEFLSDLTSGATARSARTVRQTAMEAWGARGTKGP